MRMTDDSVLHLLDGAITGLPVVAVAYFTVRASAGDIAALGRQTITTPDGWKGGLRLRLVKLFQARRTGDGDLAFGPEADAGFDRGMLAWLLAGTLCAVLGRATSDVPRLCRILAGGAVAALVLALTTSMLFANQVVALRAAERNEDSAFRRLAVAAAAVALAGAGGIAVGLLVATSGSGR